MMQARMVEMREKLRKYNPKIGIPEISNYFISTGYFLNLDNHSFWAYKENRKLAIGVIHGLGIPSIGDQGLVIARRGDKKSILVHGQLILQIFFMV